jgi:ATP-dependent DNA helicase DinG
MGLNGESRSEMVGTPFDLKNQAILYLPRDLPAPNSNAHLEAIAETMLELVKLSGGRAFLLFTSYRVLEEVYKKLSGSIKANILKQGDAPRTELIEKFRAENSVLFATTSFWQGVDVMGDALSLVVIDKLPFAVPTDPVVEARSEWIQKNGGDAFYEYQLPRAVLLLKQGLGRLLRHRNDRGILAVLDPRIHRRGYGVEVKKSLEEFTITDSWKDVEDFARININGIRPKA